jgi:hypothetical protein
LIETIFGTPETKKVRTQCRTFSGGYNKTTGVRTRYLACGVSGHVSGVITMARRPALSKAMPTGHCRLLAEPAFKYSLCPPKRGRARGAFVPDGHMRIGTDYK